MNTRKKINVFVGVVFLFSFLLNVGVVFAKEDVYKFALMAPLTGDAAQYGQTYKTTLEILVDQVNASGGINGSKLVLDVYDDKKDPKESVNIASKVISDPDILGLVGSQTSSCSMAAAPILQEEGIPMVSPQASHPDFTKIGNYIFRCQVTVEYENAKTAEFLAKTLGKKRIAIIYSNDDWGVSMVDSTKKALKQYPGNNVVAEETFIVGQTKDFTPLVSKIKMANPDVLFLATLYSDGAQIIQQCKALNLDVPIVGSNTFFKKEFIEVGGDNVEGVMMTNTIALNNDNAEYLALQKTYQEKTGSFIDTYVTQSYDSLNILIKAAKKVGKNRSAIRDELASMKDYQGVSGTFSFDEFRNPEKKVYVYEIKDGSIVQMTE